MSKLASLLLVAGSLAYACDARAGWRAEGETQPADGGRLEEVVDTGLVAPPPGSESIVDGAASEFRAVIAIWRKQPDGTFQGRCSGVKIRNDVVLTAKHCIDPDSEPSDWLMSDADDVNPYLVGATLETIPGNLALGTSYAYVSDAPWTECTANPDSSDSYWTDDCDLPDESAALAQEDDLALLWFDSDSDLANGLLVPTMPSGYAAEELAISHRFIGYGADIDCVTASAYRRRERIADTFNVTETYLEVTRVIGGGDSGGPVLYEDDGLWMVAGTMSSCSGRNDDLSNPPSTGRVARVNTDRVRDWLDGELERLDPPVCGSCGGIPSVQRCSDGYEMSWQPCGVDDGGGDGEPGCGGCSTGAELRSLPSVAGIWLLALLGWRNRRATVDPVPGRSTPSRSTTRCRGS